MKPQITITERENYTRKVETTEGSRTASYYTDGVPHGMGSPNVYQSHTWSHPMVLEAPKINWGSPGGVTPNEARSFLAALKDAIAIADEWSKDIGKPIHGEGGEK